MEKNDRLKAREYLLRMRIYRIFALVFAAVGVLVFVYLYTTRIEGHVLTALKQPATVLILLLPFLPAFVFSWLCARAESKLTKVLERYNHTQGPQGGEG